MAILDSSAVVVLKGISRNPIIPKLISAVMIIGTEAINPIFIFLNIIEISTIMIIKEKILMGLKYKINLNIRNNNGIGLKPTFNCAILQTVA